jgi:hypothetical protein
MADLEQKQTRRRWGLIAAALLIGVSLGVGARTINPWLSAVLWLAVGVLIAQIIRSLGWKRQHQVMVNLTVLVLAFVVWNYTARQPRMRVDSIQLRYLPSTGRSGLVELNARNAGASDAAIVVESAAVLSPFLRNAQELRIANIQSQLEERLNRATPMPAEGTTAVPVGETTVINVDVPFSEQVWQVQRGNVTLVVAARIRYRDRIFNRERLFCQYANPQSGNWVSCPFLNN